MADYIADNPQFVVNGFRCAGISGVLDGSEADKKNLDVSDYDVGVEILDIPPYY